MNPYFHKILADSEWGCIYKEIIDIATANEIKICFAEVNNLINFANSLCTTVQDSSWMTNFDKGVRRQYDYTFRQTANLLVDIFNTTASTQSIGSEFGELMVSIGSARALKKIFDHTQIPIAELWKPQIKQNEGFDFHTICNEDYINFGEAKYSKKSNPHGLALNQTKMFVKEDKHFRDRGHLLNLVNEKAIANLDNDDFGIVAAFSINSDDPLNIIKNSIESALAIKKEISCKQIYLVGVQVNG